MAERTSGGITLRSDGDAEARGPSTLLEVEELVAAYVGRRRRRAGRSRKVAVNAVSFDLMSGRCLAVVGESGSGKTTLARCLAGLHAPDAGRIVFDGELLPGLARERPLDTRRRIQIVFQDPDSSLNPSMTVGDSISRPLVQFFHLGRREQSARVRGLLEQVRLAPTMASRIPSELSGGEKQRVAIARAVAAQPDLLICDEITSALDVAVQASILELLRELRTSSGLSMVFVTHDLAVVRTIADQVLVMSQGEVRELEPTQQLFASPSDEYTRRLLAAAPDLNDGDYPDTGSTSTRDLERTAP